jgi:hypothetical protein
MRTRNGSSGVLLAIGSLALVACGAHDRWPNEEVEELGEELSGTVEIQAVSSGKCADVTGASKANLAQIQQWGCSGHTNQQWTLKSVGTGIYNLVSVNSGKCMDVSGASMANGAKVIQYTCSSGNNQRWKITSAGTGQYHLQAVHSGQCLDVTGNSTASGAAFEQWPCHNSANQTFKLTGATGGGGTGGSGGSGGSSGGGGAPSASALLALTNGCKVVSAHSYALDNGTKTNICALNGAIFWKADMDIDCDGKTTTQCNSNTDCCYQNDTAFHNNSDQPLTASTTPYVVIPNDFHYSGLDTSNGGNVTAVIYNGKLIYAVFGDTGPTNIIGEASYATAQKLGINPDPSNGGVGSGVTYITFVGSGTRPSNIEDQSETTSLGQKLAASLIAKN